MQETSGQMDFTCGRSRNRIGCDKGLWPYTYVFVDKDQNPDHHVEMSGVRTTIDDDHIADAKRRQGWNPASRLKLRAEGVGALN